MNKAKLTLTILFSDSVWVCSFYRPSQEILDCFLFPALSAVGSSIFILIYLWSELGEQFEIAVAFFLLFADCSFHRYVLSWRVLKFWTLRMDHKQMFCGGHCLCFKFTDQLWLIRLILWLEECEIPFPMYSCLGTESVVMDTSSKSSWWENKYQQKMNKSLWKQEYKE